MWHSIVWKDCPAGEQAPLVLPAHVPTIPTAAPKYNIPSIPFDDDDLPMYTGYRGNTNSFWYAYNKLKEFIVKEKPSVPETK
jgi:hypothetical protein